MGDFDDVPGITLGFNQDNGHGHGQQDTSSFTNASPCVASMSSGTLNKSQEELPGSISADFIFRFRDRFSKEHSYVVTSKSREILQLPGSFLTGKVSTLSYSVEAAVVDGLNNSSCSDGSPLYVCVPEMGTGLAFKQTSDDNPSDDPLGIPGSVERWDSPRQSPLMTDASLHRW